MWGVSCLQIVKPYLGREYSHTSTLKLICGYVLTHSSYVDRMDRRIAGFIKNCYSSGLNVPGGLWPVGLMSVEIIIPETIGMSWG